MNFKKAGLPWGAAALALGLSAAGAEAGEYRILFQGNGQVAADLGAGYLPAENAANEAGNCPTCVPGGTKAANYGAGVPNQIVTFLHPYTNKAVTIPLTLPVGRPRIETKSDRIIYNYGGLFGKRVVVKFLPKGMVEVRYRT